MSYELASRRVLVTGASSGIGAAVAKAFAMNGANVVAHYNSGEEEIRALIDSTRGIVPLRAELLQPGAGAELVENASNKLGGLDILVNNAGAVIRRVPFEDFDDDVFEQSLTLNVRSVIASCKTAIPYLERSGHGAIVNVGSIAAYDGGGPGWSHYAGAKAYVQNLTRHLARVLASRRIRVNAIAPGVIDTRFHAETPRQRMDAAATNIPMGRLGTAEDCVGPVLFLSSSACSGYVTGQIVNVNGGQYLA